MARGILFSGIQKFDQQNNHQGRQLFVRTRNQRIIMELQDPHFLLFFIHVLMFHFSDQFLQIIETNAFALEEPSYEMQMKLWVDKKENLYPNPMNFCIKKRQIGTALYKNVSRFNHSCDPNVAFVFDKQSQRIILASTRYIEKGEELTISYGPVYHINKVVNIYI